MHQRQFVSSSPARHTAECPPKASTQSSPWFRDFFWRDGQIHILKTGIAIKPSWPLLNEILNWAIYLAILNCVSAVRYLAGRHPGTVCFLPDRARPWYLVRGAAMWAGLRTCRSVTQAQVSVYFDDSTVGVAPVNAAQRQLNYRCTNIAKSYVAHIFADVFGYPLTVDPTTTVGDIVEKPERNGVHGGRVIVAPCQPRSGFTYQRVVDTRNSDGCCEDLRTPCADGMPVVVWQKVKTPQGRFSINNKRAYLKRPSDVFSSHELLQIAEFCARMGLDWGGLDILRDRQDGRIYIVDVNKTDLGPVIALSWIAKIRSMQRLSKALLALVEKPSTPPDVHTTR